MAVKFPVPAYRNAAYNARGTIDCQIDHPVLGWIPFTVTPGDRGAEFDVAALEAQIRTDNQIAPYTPPSAAEALAAERAGMVCSRFQARAALMAAGLLEAATAAVAAADPVTQLAWADAIEFRRSSPTILALAPALGLTEEQIDDLFRAAMAISA